MTTYGKVSELIGHPVVSVTGKKVNLCLIHWISFIRCNAAASGLEYLLASEGVFAVFFFASEPSLHVNWRLGFGRSATA